MRLILAHPEVAFRDCADCQKIVYNEETGERMKHHGKEVKRPGRVSPPCGYGEARCPKGNPEANRELSERNWAAYSHWLECKAVGRFPDDPIVRRNAALIQGVVNSVERGRHDQENRRITEMMRRKR